MSTPAFTASIPARAVPPGPKGLPVLGSLLDMGRDTLGFLSGCVREHGDVVALRLGSWPTLLISNPDDIETVLVRNHENFVKNTFFWRHVTALFGQGILTSEGEYWRRHRKIIAPVFSGRNLTAYATTMGEMTEAQMDGWRAGEVVDLHGEMMALALRIAAKTLFDASVETDIGAIDRATEDIVTEIRARFVRPFLIPDWAPLPGHIRYRRAIRAVEEVLDRMIAERRAAGGTGGRVDFLSQLMNVTDDDGRPMPDRQLRDEAITHLLAGHETTAIAMSWTFQLLSLNPEARRRLHDEVDGVLAGRAPTIEDIPRLPFTESVALESMRLRPPAWGIGREALRDCELGGYHVPAGTTIFILPWIQHRDPRWFDDPEAFRPERWMDGLARRIPRFAYLPFGGGPRICIGQRFAMIELVLLVAGITRRFDLEWQADRPVELVPSITLRPKGGVWVRIHDRRTHH